uniref:Uncharacterized protein n=1 Tax=Cannabis sativa TaxID=3483 RepID=A0A803PLQ0_CANSA
MGIANFDLGKFTEKNFRLWMVKMRALLVQQGIQATLLGEEKLPASLAGKEKTEALDKAHNGIILSLWDKKYGNVGVASKGEDTDGYESLGVLIAFNSDSRSIEVLDSGCSFYICPDKSRFSKFQSIRGYAGSRWPFSQGGEGLHESGERFKSYYEGFEEEFIYVLQEILEKVEINNVSDDKNDTMF